MTPKSTCVGWLGSEDFKALRSSYKKNEIIRIESIDKKRNQRRLLHIWEVGADRASSNLGLGPVRTPAKLYGLGYERGPCSFRNVVFECLKLDLWVVRCSNRFQMFIILL